MDAVPITRQPVRRQSIDHSTITQSLEARTSRHNVNEPIKVEKSEMADITCTRVDLQATRIAVGPRSQPATTSFDSVIPKCLQHCINAVDRR